MHFSYTTTLLALASVSTLVSGYPAGNKANNTAAAASANGNGNAKNSPLGQLAGELNSLLDNLPSRHSPRLSLSNPHDALSIRTLPLYLIPRAYTQCH